MKLHPIQFRPILKDKIWGGSKLKALLQKQAVSTQTGESWEISAVEGDVSVVENGSLAGKKLTTLIDEFKEELVGKRVWKKYGRKFPLLFKFIDAGENLSLQLHPDDELAMKRHRSFGKTEMWYIMQADREAGIYAGFIPGTKKEDYLRHLEAGTLQDIMNFISVREGDVFFIKAGLVHAIGKGVLLAEIQQSSDITYRVYDWNRKDKDGKERELHTEWAAEAIDFDFKDYKIKVKPQLNVFQELVKNAYFHTRKLNLEGEVSCHYENSDSFIVIMAVKGNAEIHTDLGNAVVKTGSSLLLPASAGKVVFKSRYAEILEVRA